MNARTLGCTLCVTLTLACSAAAIAADKTLRTYPLGKYGTLSLPVDSKWREVSVADATLPTIGFESATPSRFQLLVTPIPVAAGKTQSDADVRALVEKSAREMAPQSVEKRLPVTGIAGAEAKGYVFHATDPAPGPGEYKLMYQGAVALGNMLATFTVLYNDGAEEDAKSALASVQALHYAPAQ